MNESYVTLQGWVGADVDVREVGETPVASFRIGSTPRYLRAGSWVDGETSWYTVNCWRVLARHVAGSVHRGDAVVVHGRVRTDVWDREDGTRAVAWVVDATFVGHDLTKGTSVFTKAPASRGARPAVDPRQAEEVREVVHAYGAEGPQLDAEGVPVTPEGPAASAA
ncbi:MAG: ssb1 [Marmoricola sp.]|nr:ssb1 [Marmoricola sp.]